MVSKEDIDKALLNAFELWGISSDTIEGLEAFHSLRLIRIREEKTIPSYDDFMVSWRKYKSEVK